MISAQGKYEALARNQIQGDIDNAVSLVGQFALTSIKESDLAKVSDSMQYLIVESQS